MVVQSYEGQGRTQKSVEERVWGGEVSFGHTFRLTFFLVVFAKLNTLEGDRPLPSLSLSLPLSL
jgi:hypothetical protein